MTGFAFRWGSEPIEDLMRARTQGLQRLIDFYQKNWGQEFTCHHCGHETNNNHEATALYSPELILVKCIKCKQQTLFALSDGVPVSIHNTKSTLHFYCVWRIPK